MSGTTPLLPLRTVRDGAHEFNVADTHPEFWDRFSSGQWEPDTLAIFDHYLDADTVHLDVGAWIGPTCLHAATRARQVIGFEPDPVAFASLQRSASANPALAPITVHSVAIAPQAGVLTMGAREQPGDSMSSSLFAEGNAIATWKVTARRLEEFEGSWPAGAPVFLKIDIEGGEYALLPALSGFIRRHRPTLHLSLHSSFFLGRSVEAGVVNKSAHELRLAWNFLRNWPLFRQYPYIYTAAGRRLAPWQLAQRGIWRRTPALLFAWRPLPPGLCS